MKKILLIRGAKQLLTLHGPSGPRRGMALRDLGLIQDGAVLIIDGIIRSAGLSRRIENLAEARAATEVIEAAGRVVMPGFVDSHTHLVTASPRLVDYEMRLAGAAYDEIAAMGGGILSSVRALRGVSGRVLGIRTRRQVHAFLRHGTTTIEAKSGYGLDDTGELKTLRVIHALDGAPADLVATYLGAHATPPEFSGRPDEYIDWMIARMLPLVRKRKLAKFADVYCEPGAFNVPQARRYLEAARKLGFLVKMHANQFSRLESVPLAVDLGAVSVDHLEQAGDHDAALLGASQTIATLLPGSVFHLGLEKYAPARKLIDSGAAVAIATDYNPGTSPTCNMQMVIALACAEMKMTPAEAIAAATINGAHALRVADRAGSLECGKQGDVLILDASDYREIPYHFGVNLVQQVLKRGEVVYQEPEPKWTED